MGPFYFPSRSCDPVHQLQRDVPIFYQLRPNHDSVGLSTVVHCSVELHIKCSDNYPLSPPTVIKPVNAKGLDNDQIAELQRNLTQMAKDRVGEVMIMDIGKRTLVFHLLLLISQRAEIDLRFMRPFVLAEIRTYSKYLRTKQRLSNVHL